MTTALAAGPLIFTVPIEHREETPGPTREQVSPTGIWSRLVPIGCTMLRYTCLPVLD